MSNGYWNYAAQNNSYDWNVVLAGTGTLKTSTVLGLGQAFHFYDHPDAPSSTQWVELVGDGTTTLASLLPSGASLDLTLTANRTVNIAAGLSTSAIQALIDAQPKNLNGYNLTFQFADGATTGLDDIDFVGFHGGQLRVYGNSSDTSVSTTKSVALTFNADQSINFESCDFPVMRYIRVNGTSHTAAGTSIISIASCSAAIVDYCATVGPSSSLSANNVSRSIATISNLAAESMARAVSSSLGSIVSVSGLSYTTIGTELYSTAFILSSDATTSYVEVGAGSVRDTGGFKS